MKFRKIAAKIALAVFYIFLFLLAYQVIMKISGHSPSVDALQSSAIIMLATFLFYETHKAGEFMGEMRAFKGGTIKSFAMMRKDMDGVKEDIAGVKKDMDGVKKDIDGLKVGLDDISREIGDIKRFLRTASS